MSAMNEWTEWHLTPRGWERGTVKTDTPSSTTVAPPPPDRVLTCRFHEFLGAIGGDVEHWVEEVWAGPDRETVRALLDQHGSCPESL